jgi:hypothetical protein
MVNVLTPAVKPVRTKHRETVTNEGSKSVAATASEDATVDAPLTATDASDELLVLLLQSQVNVISADVPVVNVTDGLVPGEPVKVAVNDVLVTLPVASVLDATGVIQTHALPL